MGPIYLVLETFNCESCLQPCVKSCIIDKQPQPL